MERRTAPSRPMVEPSRPTTPSSRSPSAPGASSRTIVGPDSACAPPVIIDATRDADDAGDAGEPARVHGIQPRPPVHARPRVGQTCTVPRARARRMPRMTHPARAIRGIRAATIGRPMLQLGPDVQLAPEPGDPTGRAGVDDVTDDRITEAALVATAGTAAVGTRPSALSARESRTSPRRAACGPARVAAACSAGRGRASTPSPGAASRRAAGDCGR